jgi:hypothetical protein
MEDTFTHPDACDKDPLIKFTLTLSPEDDSKSCQIPESTHPPLVAPSPRTPTPTIQPMRPHSYEDNESERAFSRPLSPSLASLPLNPHRSPASPNFRKRTTPRPPTPLYFSASGSASDCLNSMSCPTSPHLRVGSTSPLPYPPSPSARQAMFSNVSRRLRTLNPSPNLSRVTSAVPSRPMSPMSQPTSPVLQAFNMEHWAPERDPTECIDVIEIMVTREVSVCIEESC